MNVPDWQRRAQSVIDVGRLPSFSLQGSGRRAGRITLILLVLVGLYSTYYQVNADEVGVVQRFGRYVRTTGPGAHVKIPFVERVTRVPVQRQLKTEFGFDMVQVAKNRYSSQRYHDFIGFRVSQPLLERAFPVVYGVELKDVLPRADLAIGSVGGLESGFHEQTLYGQDFVCLVSAKHPRIGIDGLTSRQYLQEGHVGVLTGASYRSLHSFGCEVAADRLEARGRADHVEAVKLVDDDGMVLFSTLLGEMVRV